MQFVTPQNGVERSSQQIGRSASEFRVACLTAEKAQEQQRRQATDDQAVADDEGAGDEGSERGGVRHGGTSHDYPLTMHEHRVRSWVASPTASVRMARKFLAVTPL